MLVVIDANILFSILISAKGNKQALLFSEELEAISPDFILFEIGKHWPEIIEKSRFSEDDLDSAFSLVREQIKTFSFVKYTGKLSEAKAICPDIKDVEYFALALECNCPLWTEDKGLKEQSKIEVLNTKELLEKLGLT